MKISEITKDGVAEGKFRKIDAEEKLIPNDKLNDLKSKYLPDWEMLDHRILQAKYVAKDHRHAEEFVSFINRVSEEMDHFAEVTQDVAEVSVKTSTFDVKGLTILDFKLALKIDKFAERDEIEQVRMQGNFGMHESTFTNSRVRYMPGSGRGEWASSYTWKHDDKYGWHVRDPKGGVVYKSAESNAYKAKEEVKAKAAELNSVKT